jgi:multimeric flavodoxin WrbA
MNSLAKFILKLCFGVWLITSILPEVIQNDYKIVFLVSKGLIAVIFALVLFAFFNPLLRKKPQTVTGNEKTRLILHDLDIETAKSLLCDVPNTQVFSARRKMAKCFGCFGCWLRTPGICIMHDGTESLGKQIACCDEFIIISKSLYGGFSKEIKNALDRSIAFVLPFFEIRNREQHHQARYAKSGKIRSCIYSSSKVSDADKALLTEITKANCINMNKSNYETVFVNDVQELKGALS